MSKPLQSTGAGWKSRGATFLSKGPQTRLLVGSLVVSLAFAWPLFHWFRLSQSDENHSYLLSIPFLSAYLIWNSRNRWEPVASAEPSEEIRLWAVLGTLSGLMALLLGVSGPTDGAGDGLGAGIVSWVCWMQVVAAGSLGHAALQRLRFPLWFLFFAVPLPRIFFETLETWLQYGSAATAPIGFWLTGLDYQPEGLRFHFPGISIEVARECSGIRSTIALFLTSWIAAFMFLGRGWSRAVLILFSIPLGIVRNAIRITVIAWLCVKIDPSMIDSLIHRKGGPLFFAMSLLMLGGMVAGLRKLERRPAAPTSPTAQKSASPRSPEV